MPTSTLSKNTSLMEAAPKDSLLTQKADQGDELESTKAEMGEVKEENERLKQLVAKIMKDYQSLQMQFFDIVKEDEAKKSTDFNALTNYQENEEIELVSLSLGINSSDEPKKDENKKEKLNTNVKDDGESMNEGLTLGLDYKFEPERGEVMKNNQGSESTCQEENEDQEPTELWPPSKVLKTMRSGDDDQAMQQSHLKKARVCVRARCDTPTMNDGCQWRKYGQKIAKGNPCPRAYYRCTVSPNCPVRKQVQRCAEDMSILITTYEGTHNHPLPVSATAMASTTSAAASMLQSRISSSTSEPGLNASTSILAPISMSTPNSSHNISGLNFTFSQNPRTPQFYFPNSSISTSNSHPTITLDLTGHPNSSNFTRTFPSTQRYNSPTCLNFSSASSSTNPSSYFSYGTPSYNSIFNLARQTTQEKPYQPFVQTNNLHTSSSQHSLTEKIAQATKVITTNPTFQSALAVALTTYVGNNGARDGHSSVVDGSCLNLKLGESLPMSDTSGFSFTKSGSVGCASSYYNKSSSLNSQQQGSLNLFPHSLPVFATSKSSSSSPADNKDHA